MSAIRNSYFLAAWQAGSMPLSGFPRLKHDGPTGANPGDTALITPEESRTG